MVLDDRDYMRERRRAESRHRSASWNDKKGRDRHAPRILPHPWQKWHGTTLHFGSNTSYETVVELMAFEPRSGHIIDLHRRPDGNLKTPLMLTRPQKLWPVC